MTGEEIDLFSLNGRQPDEHDLWNVRWFLTNGATQNLEIFMQAGEERRAYTIEHFTDDEKVLSMRVRPERDHSPTGYLLLPDVQWPKRGSNPRQHHGLTGLSGTTSHDSLL